MLIYQMTHTPSGKIYIGSLKKDERWNTYCTSSSLVKSMMKTDPNDWKREILLKDFCRDVTFADVVALEQRLIKAAIDSYGKENVLNRGYYHQQSKLYSTQLPKSAFKKGHKPWNYGKSNAQTSDRKGKTFVEIYGEEKANEIIAKRQASRGNKGYRKPGEYTTSDETRKKISESLKKYAQQH
jgi:hypothetical protein